VKKSDNLIGVDHANVNWN